MVDLLVVLFGLYIPFLFFCCLNAYESHWCYILCTMYRAHWNKLNSKHSVAQHLFVCWYTKRMEIYKHSSFSPFQNMSLQMPFLSSNNHHHYYLLLHLHFNHHYHRHGYLQHIKFVHKGHSSFFLSSICLQTTATSSKDRLFTTFYKYFTNTGLNFYNGTELEKPSINWLIYFNCNCVYYIFKFLNYTDIFSVCHFLFYNHQNFDQTIQLEQKCYEENSSTISLKCCLFC